MMFRNIFLKAPHLKVKTLPADERKYYLLRALAYFEDAEKSAEPKMLRPVNWEEIKKFFRAEVKRLWQEVEKTF